MKKNCLRLIMGVLLTCVPYLGHADTFVIGDDSLHLCFTLDPDTKEAAIGRPGGYEHNALCFEDDEDGLPYFSSLWGLDMIVPSILTYNDETYTVVGVMGRAFYKTTYIKKITLPETIRYMESEAFSMCVNLESVIIPPNAPLESIDKETFYYCKKLQSIHLPGNIKSIGASAFSDCYELTEINIPGNCNKVENDAFLGCQKLSKLTIEDGETVLDCGYTYGVALMWNDSEQPKYRGLFGDCPIKEVYVGRNLQYPSISGKIYSPFYSISNYGTGIIGVQLSQGKMFSSVLLGDAVTDISDSLFWDCSTSNAITLPSKLKTIGKWAFSSTSGNGFFHGQTQLVIPNSVERIGTAAFFECTTLRKIIFESQTPPEIEPRALHYLKNYSYTYYSQFYVPSGCREIYCDSLPDAIILDPADEMLTINVRTAGSLYSRLLAQDIQAKNVYRLKLKGILNEDDYITLREMKFLYDCDLSDLTITQLPYNLFKENRALTYIKLPTNLTSIPDSMFRWCPYLSGDIEIPSTCSRIGQLAFPGTGIRSILYNHPLIIGERAFASCFGLDSLRILGIGTIVGKNAFDGSSVKHLTLGAGVSVEEEAFSYSHIEEIFLEDGVKYLGKNVFDGCGFIKKIFFNGMIDQIDETPFPKNHDWQTFDIYLSDIASWLNMDFLNIESNPLCHVKNIYLNNELMTKVEIPEGIERIREYAFYNCKDLQSVILPEGLRVIGKSAFQNCSITGLKMPSTLLNIEQDAFSGCRITSELDFPLSVQSIGQSAFSDCSNISRIVAHWDNPFVLGEDAFRGINGDCYLYIPIGTATKYVKNGWNAIPNMKEAGILKIKMNEGGSVTYADSTLTNTLGTFFFNPFKSFSISLIPNDGKAANIILLNNVEVSAEVEDGALFIEEPDENINLEVVFTNSENWKGDVNLDGLRNKIDVFSIANYILRQPSEKVIKYIGDMNNDNKINVTDIIILVNKILNNN